jgi:hypothetical protein
MSQVVGLRSTGARLVAAAVLVVVLVVVALTVRLFIYPDRNAPQRANAIVVLGGNGAGPFDTGTALARERIAPTIVFSLVPGYSCEPSVLDLSSVRVLCFLANPHHTV